MTAIQEWLGNYYAMWRHHLMIRTSSLVVIAFIFSELRVCVCVCGGGGGGGLPLVVEDHKKPALNGVKGT